MTSQFRLEPSKAETELISASADSQNRFPEKKKTFATWTESEKKWPQLNFFSFGLSGVLAFPWQVHLYILIPGL